MPSVSPALWSWASLEFLASEYGDFPKENQAKPVLSQEERALSFASFPAYFGLVFTHSSCFSTQNREEKRNCTWKWLICLENRTSMPTIPSCVLIIEKCGSRFQPTTWAREGPFRLADWIYECVWSYFHASSCHSILLAFPVTSRLFIIMTPPPWLKTGLVKQSPAFALPYLFLLTQGLRRKSPLGLYLSPVRWPLTPLLTWLPKATHFHKLSLVFLAMSSEPTSGTS